LIFDFVPVQRWNDPKVVDYLVVSNSAFQWFEDEQLLKTYINKCKLYDDYLTLMVDKQTGGSGSCCYRKCLTGRGILKICVAIQKDYPNCKNDEKLRKRIQVVLALIKKLVFSTRTLNKQELEQINKNKPVFQRPLPKRQTMSAVPLSTAPKMMSPVYGNMTDEELDESILRSLDIITEEAEKMNEQMNEKDEKEPKDELVDDVLQILNVYTAKMNEIRKYSFLYIFISMVL